MLLKCRIKKRLHTTLPKQDAIDRCVSPLQTASNNIREFAHTSYLKEIIKDSKKSGRSKLSSIRRFICLILSTIVRSIMRKKKMKETSVPPKGSRKVFLKNGVDKFTSNFGYTSDPSMRLPI